VLLRPPAPSAADWIISDVSSNLLEVALGQLAQSRASNPIVKQFGQRMIQDHAPTAARAQQLARMIGVESPTAPSEEEHVTALSYLSQFSGPEFDRQYIGYEVIDHRNDIAEANIAVRNLQKMLADYAYSTIPMLQEHLRLASEDAQILRAPIPPDHS